MGGARPPRALLRSARSKINPAANGGMGHNSSTGLSTDRFLHCDVPAHHFQADCI